MNFNEIYFPIFQDFPEVMCRSVWRSDANIISENMQNEPPHAGKGFFPETVEENRSVLAQQIHGSEVVYATTPGTISNCDGLFSREENLNLVIRTADCAAVMLYDPESSAITNLHVGWRGAHAAIIHSAIEALKKKYGTHSRYYRVAVGPAIHSCCYNVGREFHDYFDKSFLLPRNGQLFFNLPAVIKRQLLSEGVVLENIEISDQCTRCSGRVFPSYRRNKTRQRVWNIIEKEGDHK